MAINDINVHILWDPQLRQIMDYSAAHPYFAAAARAGIKEFTEVRFIGDITELRMGAYPSDELLFFYEDWIIKHG